MYLKISYTFTNAGGKTQRAASQEQFWEENKFSVFFPPDLGLR